MKSYKKLYIVCRYCGKHTKGGRLPGKGRYMGDGAARYPRRHKGRDGKDCPGNIVEGEWMEIKH